MLNIKALCKAKGLNYSKLSKATRINRITLRQWDAGNATNPGKIILLCKALDISPNELLEWEDEKLPRM